MQSNQNKRFNSTKMKMKWTMKFKKDSEKNELSIERRIVHKSAHIVRSLVAGKAEYVIQVINDWGDHHHEWGKRLDKDDEKQTKMKHSLAHTHTLVRARSLAQIREEREATRKKEQQTHQHMKQL